MFYSQENKGFQSMFCGKGTSRYQNK